LIPSALNCKFFLSLDSRSVHKQCSVHKQLHTKTHPRQIEVPYLRHLAAAVEGCATVEGRAADEGRAVVEGCRRRRLSLYIFRFSFRFFFFLWFNHSNLLFGMNMLGFSSSTTWNQLGNLVWAYFTGKSGKFGRFYCFPIRILQSRYLLSKLIEAERRITFYFLMAGT